MVCSGKIITADTCSLIGRCVVTATTMLSIETSPGTAVYVQIWQYVVYTQSSYVQL